MRAFSWNLSAISRLSALDLEQTRSIQNQTSSIKLSCTKLRSRNVKWAIKIYNELYWNLKWALQKSKQAIYNFGMLFHRITRNGLSKGCPKMGMVQRIQFSHALFRLAMLSFPKRRVFGVCRPAFLAWQFSVRVFNCRFYFPFLFSMGGGLATVASWIICLAAPCRGTLQTWCHYISFWVWTGSLLLERQTGLPAKVQFGKVQVWIWTLVLNRTTASLSPFMPYGRFRNSHVTEFRTLCRQQNTEWLSRIFKCFLLEPHPRPTSPTHLRIWKLRQQEASLNLIPETVGAQHLVCLVLQERRQ